MTYLHKKLTPTLCMLGNFSCFCCHQLAFFQNSLFQKILSGTLSECQMVWIQIRMDVLPVLIWVQTVCKDHQQMTNSPLAGKELRQSVRQCNVKKKEIKTLNVPITTKVVCFCRLLKCLRSLFGKQCGPRSDCSYRSSLIWVLPVCFYT